MTQADPTVDRRVFKQWIERCPLRIWRKENEVSIMEAATRLGVSMTLIQLWERGVHVPSGENMQKLIRLMGVEVVQQWQDFYNSRPTG